MRSTTLRKLLYAELAATGCVTGIGIFYSLQHHLQKNNKQILISVTSNEEN